MKLYQHNCLLIFSFNQISNDEGKGQEILKVANYILFGHYFERHFQHTQQELNCLSKGFRTIHNCQNVPNFAKPYQNYHLSKYELH